MKNSESLDIGVETDENIFNTALSGFYLFISSE